MHLMHMHLIEINLMQMADCKDWKLSAIQRTGTTQAAASHKYFIYRRFYST